MSTAILMVTYKDNWDYLMTALRSVFRYTEDFHLFLICNAPEKRAFSLSAAKLPNTSVIYNTENLHWAGGINQGIRLSKGFDWIAFLNDDIELVPDWQQNLISFLKNNPRIGAVGPLNNNTRDWQGIVNVRKRMPITKLPEHLTGNEPLEEINSILQNLPVSGIEVRGMLAFFCTMFHRSTIDEVGELDEEFIMGGDDDDYARRLEAVGKGLGLSTRICVGHYGGYSLKNSEWMAKYDGIRRQNVNRLKAKYPEYYGA